MNGPLDQYAGVVLNQNATPTGVYPWRSQHPGEWVYQVFTLPDDYTRGSDSTETRNPDLAGFQVLVSIDSGAAANAAVNFVLQSHDGNWNTLTSGSVASAHADGTYVWYDVYFNQSVPVSVATVVSQTQFRFGIQLPAGSSISQVYYVSPTPLLSSSVAQGQAYRNDGVTPIVSGNTASLNFRLLALSADSGIDFLGNEYRSCVVESSPINTDTTDSHTYAYWMSPPRPSRFAVESLYFDVRPVPVNPGYGPINFLTNPSFEYDALGAHTARGWVALGGTLTITTGQGSTSGLQAARVDGTTTGAASPSTPGLIGWQYPTPIAVQPGVNYQVTATTTVSVNQLGNVSVVVSWFQSDGTPVIDSGGNTITSIIDTWSALGPHASSGTATAPATAHTAQLSIYASGTSSGESFTGWLDAVSFVQSDTAVGFFDGDQPDCGWLGQPGVSASAQLISAEPTDDFVVIDGVLVDPITPNVAMNVYYSQDNSGTSTNMTESDWDNKLWTRVPQSFVLNQRKQYMFPAPIHAKYMKLEFTNLQGRSYTPSDFQRPVQYKKFPTWVANYFLAQMELPSFVASQVNVQYNALTFAYRYYLDDLHSSPATPVAPATGLQGSLTSYFNTSPSGVDATTLAQINLTMQPFNQAIGQNVDTTTQLGSLVAGVYNGTSTVPQVVESGNLPPIDYTTVSSINRESVLLEQTLPIMYFFLTCRHGYKTLTALFEQQRAYFVGINDVAFLRSDYGVAADTALYIETNGDMTNVALSDFILDTDNNWYVY